MRARWSHSFQVRTFDDEWERRPPTPGVYVVGKDTPVRRVNGTDRAGILYIGGASKLRYRIWQFLKGYHTASGFLLEHRPVARVVLNGRIRTDSDVKRELGKLTVRFATPIHGQLLERAERALLFAYVRAFGEAPPLNLSLPRRWDATPSVADLRWAEKGLQRSK